MTDTTQAPATPPTPAPAPVSLWEKIKSWFKHSETILFARIQVAFGLLIAVIPGLNPIAWLDPTLTKAQRYTMAVWAVVSGLATEILRRRGATDLH